MIHKPAEILGIGGADILRIVDPARAMEVLAEGFKALSFGEVQAPARPKIEVPGKGISLAMLAWMPGQLIAQKTVHVYHGNATLGIETHQALVSLFDADTGVPVAVLDGASLTGIRTAAAAILSVRELARKDAKVVTIVGSGLQGREHLRMIRLAGNFQDVRIWARSPDAARRLAGGTTGCVAVEDLEQAVKSSDVICLTTGAQDPVIEADWIKPGTHVTSVGFAPPGSEVPPALVGRARIFVEAKSAFQPSPVGCVELQGMDVSRGTEMGEMLLGRKPGRLTDSEVTLYKSMGNGMEDLVVANLAFQEAKRLGIGKPLVL